MRPLCSRHNTHDANNVLIHAPTRVRLRWQKSNDANVVFNSRTHAGCDAQLLLMVLTLFDVSIHAPTRGATAICPIERSTSPVSIHAPTRGATHRLRLVLLKDVSIHAPTRGATHRLRLGTLFQRMFSIHAPTRGCDLPPDPSPQTVKNGFNSRTHAGCDKLGFFNM